jgi:hypothetical protein
MDSEGKPFMDEGKGGREHFIYPLITIRCARCGENLIIAMSASMSPLSYYESDPATDHILAPLVTIRSAARSIRPS